MIRERQLCAAPILLLSANAFADDRERAAVIRCCEYMAKPVHVPTFLERLADLLDLEWITVAPHETTPEPLAATASRLPPELCERLRAQLDMGYVQGVIEQIDALIDAHPDLRDRLTALRSLAARFQLAELTRQLAADDSHD
ncbi:MAG TPA: hypothetical protein VGG24_15070 [Paraburkholderia sp.]